MTRIEVTEVKTMQLLPPAPDHCQVCAAKHESHEPHDPQSLYWATARQMEGKRVASWNEALEHCPDDVRDAWVVELVAMNVDLDKPGGAP